MKMLLGGDWVDRDEEDRGPRSLRQFPDRTVPRADAADVETPSPPRSKGFEVARKLTVYDRAQILFRTAKIVEGRLEEFALTIASEGSKTIREARKEARRCVNTLTSRPRRPSGSRARPSPSTPSPAARSGAAITSACRSASCWPSRPSTTP